MASVDNFVKLAVLLLTLSLGTACVHAVDTKPGDCVTRELLDSYFAEKAFKVLSASASEGACSWGYATEQENLLIAGVEALAVCDDYLVSQGADSTCEPIFIGNDRLQTSKDLARRAEEKREGDRHYPVWHIEGTPGEVYLLGSIHVLKNNTLRSEGFIRELVDKVDSLMVEVILKSPDEQAGTTTQQEASGLPEHSVDQCSAPKATSDRMALLQANAPLFHSVGIPSDSLAGTRDTCLLADLHLRLLLLHGYLPEYGVEARLSELAKAHSKPVKPLETLEQNLQTAIYSPATLTDAEFSVELENTRASGRSMDTLVVAWLNGDLAPLVARRKADLAFVADPDDYLERAFYRRNRSFAAQIRDLLGKPGKTLVSIGAAHVSGENGVLDILGKQGVTLRQIASIDFAKPKVEKGLDDHYE